MRSNAIVIVRHGETDWNLARRIQGRTQVPLNSTGRMQAEATGRLLASPQVRERWGEWHSLHSSPLERAIETARILAGVLELPAAPRIDETLWERDFGPAEGVHVAEAHERWPGLEVPGAESVEELALRAAGAFERLLAEAPGSIVVAHGSMIRVGLSHLTGTEVPRVLNGEAWVLHRDAGSELAAGRPGLLSLGVAHPAN